VLRLRVSVEPERADEVVRALGREAGVSQVAHLRAVVAGTGDDLVTASVRESSVDEVLSALRTLGVVRRGNVTFVRERVFMPGPMPWSMPRLDPGSRDIVWEEIEGQAGFSAQLAPRYLLLMGLAGLIAAVGIMQNSTVPIVGAMAVSPDLLPLVALGYGVAVRRARIARQALVTLSAGLAAAVLLAGATALVARVLGLEAEVADEAILLVGFVADPSVLGALVAFAAGVAAMLSFESQLGGAAVGVAISITTIPAAAAMGVTAVQGSWPDLLGAVVVLSTNLLCVVAGGALTVLLQRRFESRRSGR
jgi:uncharacterized hydrophobic protein (TIGR00271 family)